MGSAQWREIRPILELSLEQPTERRSEFVAAACRGNAELEAEILSLIAAYERAGYLENPADPWPGRRIGPWLLGARLGEGGMGAVYTATRADGQYDQRAAVKLVSAAILSGEAARRFWNERQLLARLDHPHIAHLLDGGATSE